MWWSRGVIQQGGLINGVTWVLGSIVCLGLCGAGSIGIAGFGLDIRECDDAFGWRSVFCVV